MLCVQIPCTNMYSAPSKENLWSFQPAFHIRTHGTTVTKLPDAIPLFALTCEPITNHDVIMMCAQYTEVYGPRNKIYRGARVMDTCNEG